MITNKHYTWIMSGVFDMHEPLDQKDGYWCVNNHVHPIWNENGSNGERSCCKLCAAKPSKTLSPSLQMVANGLSILINSGVADNGTLSHTFKELMIAHIETNHDPIDSFRLMTKIQENLNYQDDPILYESFLNLWNSVKN